VTALSVRVGDDGRARCAWVGLDTQYMHYHDDEWGVALHEDRALFEKLSLEAFQSGLSWITILRRREGFRRAFDGFECTTIAQYDQTDVERLMRDTGIIRNRAKITATIANATLLREWLSAEPSALDTLVWAHQPPPRLFRPRTLADVPTQTEHSRALSQTLRQRGWRFIGPTTAYALMQSAGLVDDHVLGCWRAT
jgi:DNA-3-methyladenine glycosylase I